jgi:hypothetical protein
VKRPVARVVLLLTLAALASSAVLVSSAVASPAWKFEGKSLEGNETIVGSASEGDLLMFGIVITCDFPYAMTIFNSAGTAKGSLNELPIVNCSTTSKDCAVEAIGPESLPWAVRGTTVSSKNYVGIEGVKIDLVFEGAICPLAEIVVTVKGIACGLFDSATHTFTFSSANFKAAGCKLAALGSPVEWNGVFSTEATGAHSGQDLVLS